MSEKFINGEFYNADVQKILKKYDVNHYSVFDVESVNSRAVFNCTLKNDMWKMFMFNGNYKWVDELLHLVSDYNACKHPSTYNLLT